MKERKGIILLVNAAVSGCNGFVPAPCCRRPTSTTLNYGIPGGINDYFDSFNDNEDDGRKGFGGVNDYLESLSRSDKSDKPDALISNEKVGGGMFNVQSNYFNSLGAETEDDWASAGDASADDPSSSDQSDLVDLWDAAAFLNFNIGPSSAAETGIDPWERAATVQQNYYYGPTDDETPNRTYEEMVAHYKARLCPKILLTQRSIQSFIYLCEECRDPHSGKWLEDFLELQNLGNYHGTGAFNITKYSTWDAVLYGIMRQPNEKMIVSAKRRGRGHGGWSKNNPYLRERWVEFKIDIRPASLVQRLLPVREQLAQEFERCFDAVSRVDERIMHSYFANLHGDNDLSTLWEQSSSPGVRNTAFARIYAATLANFTDFQEGGTSPLFGGNFDLLYSLCTQASAHRLLFDLRSHSKDDVTTQWFEQFYTDNVPSHFDGDQPFGRANDFLEALLCTPPAMVVSSDGEPIGWLEPLWIAERIIAVRSEIASEWKDLMREVKEDHLKLNDDLFRVMLGRTINDSGNEVIEIEEETILGDLSDSAGAFE